MEQRTESGGKAGLWSHLGSRLTLRPACREDDPFLFHLYCSVREPDFAFLGESERKKMLVMQFAAQQRHYMENMPEAEHLIILQDGGPIGRLTTVQRHRELHLAEIALLPQYRNHGIGSILMERLAEAGAGKGQKIRLHVYKHSPAVCFYQQLGFVTVDDDGVYLTMEKLPAIASGSDGGEGSQNVNQL
jgi:GNAT superfamily N-acetyltransferase